MLKQEPVPDDSQSDTRLLEERSRSQNVSNNRKRVKILKNNEKYSELR